MRKRNCIRTIAMVYMTLVTGGWMFLHAYANSRSRMTEEKIAPVFLTVDGSFAELEIVGSRFDFQLSLAAPESRLYFPMYLASPPELRGIIMLLCR
ncbi:MAG: hypothetical protein NC093_05090 [Alistipes sp.]|nr:hypothetical protein [Alistipes sp.]